jgi:hypothetical protein
LQLWVLYKGRMNVVSSIGFLKLSRSDWKNVNLLLDTSVRHTNFFFAGQNRLCWFLSIVSINVLGILSKINSSFTIAGCWNQTQFVVIRNDEYVSEARSHQSFPF